MPDKSPPLVIEPAELEPILGSENLLLIDLNKVETYTKGHIPGAVRMEYGQFVRIDKPRFGLLPDEDQLATVFGQTGITPETHVVAYDDEGGGNACRLLWTLHCAGHTKMSLLNGGLIAWANEGHPLETTPHSAEKQNPYPVKIQDHFIADKEYILQRLETENTRLLDTRSPEEFTGTKKLAEAGGRIPGAVNLNWLETMDKSRNFRFQDAKKIKETYCEMGITEDREIIVYCHSHHRSAHSFILLKWLGYEDVRGYPGSWSDWGNDPSTPKEI